MAGEVKRVTVAWEGALKFRGGEPGRPPILIDADNLESPGPMATLLVAVAACSGADVVGILEKMRVGLRELRVEMQGTRREDDPKRYTAIHLLWDLRGDNLDEPKARRAIDLSIEKYCSVIHSLRPDIAISYEVRLA
jgi:putative redox protein